MKANEAPEKLYVDTDDRLSDSILYGFTQKRKDDDIEYIRTDALIERACEFMETYPHMFMGVMRTEMIEDFKQYLKGQGYDVQ